MTAAALVLLALVLGVVGTTLGLLEARRQSGSRLVSKQALAVAEARAKEEARRAEADERRQAEARLAPGDEDERDPRLDLPGPRPGRTRQKDGKPLTAVLGERLDRATAEIEGEATGDPLAVARMQMTLGISQLGLGYPDGRSRCSPRRRATFTAALGPDHPDTLESMNNLAVSYRRHRPARPGAEAPRGDAGAEEGEARPRPPRHAQEHEQPRHQLCRRRPGTSGR